MREPSVFKPPEENIGRVGDPTKVPHPLPRSFRPRADPRLMLPYLYTPRRVKGTNGAGEIGPAGRNQGAERLCIRTRDVASLRAVVPWPAQYAVNSDPGALRATNVHPPANPSGKGWHQIPLARAGPHSGARREPDGAPCPAGEGRRRGLKRRWAVWRADGWGGPRKSRTPRTRLASNAASSAGPWSLGCLGERGASSSVFFYRRMGRLKIMEQKYTVSATRPKKEKQEDGVELTGDASDDRPASCAAAVSPAWESGGFPNARTNASARQFMPDGQLRADTTRRYLP